MPIMMSITLKWKIKSVGEYKNLCTLHIGMHYGAAIMRINFGGQLKS
jgi:hypothetical protein